MTTRWAALIAAVVLAIVVAAPVGAQASCAISAAPASRVAARKWPAPLDRPVTLQGDNVTLRDGLARLADAARVRLSYVAELLPLDRSICLAYRSVAAGDVLADLLRGTMVEPIVAGDDQVVLAPARRSAAATPTADSTEVHRTNVLDRVVVMGSASPIEDRATPIAMDVISGEQLTRQGTGSLAQILSGSVPGIWMWQSAPTSMLAKYGSVRGASSFGVSFPKIYIDGIEVANPLLVRQVDPSTIERLEVIRGPQGSALYGADANSGVINIITRHDGSTTGHKIELASTAGMSGSQFATAGVMTQQHALAFRTGTIERSAGIGLSIGTLGAYIPGAFARSFSATGDVRTVGQRSVFTGTARMFSERAGSPANPLLPQLTPRPAPGAFPRVHGDDAPSGSSADDGSARTAPVTTLGSRGVDTTATQSVREYTVGGTLAYTPNEQWTHTFVLGVDGYRLANPAIENGPIPSASDSALAAARGGSDRVTARITSEARFALGSSATTEVTFTAEHSTARERSSIAVMSVERLNVNGATQGAVETEQARLVGWRGNTGLVARSTTSLRDRVFLTAGLRVERNDAVLGSTRLNTLPMLGAAVVGDRGDVSLKVRAAYGKGIRPVQGAIRELAMSGRRNTLVAYDLTPEEQAGVEAGADLFIGRNLAFNVTRFDQRATGLIQSVAVAVPTSATSHAARFDDTFNDTSVRYRLQNVGEISNRGWELQSSADFGRLSLSGTLSLVDSRVQRLASGYSGDLKQGDRMLEVPSRTMSITGSWTGRGWLSSLTLSRAADWTSYDRVAVADALTRGGLAPVDLVGERLRGYWRQYNGVTRLGASFSRDLFRGVSFVATGDNLLGQQRGEPDNATVVPGRTVTAGLKAKF